MRFFNIPTSFEAICRIIKKMSKNQLKNDQKSTKNRFKIDQNQPNAFKIGPR